ncbi:MAG: S8 family serine peptidase [Clostridia bacterium]|nr:S8 family serine peptidase [Clostridia bacterium]
MNIKTVGFVKYLLLFVLVLLAVFSFTVSVCDAYLPSGYEESYKGKENPGYSGFNYDWYVDELNLGPVKAEFASWFEEKDIYDFSYFEENPIVIAVIDTGVNFNHEIFLGQYDKNGNPTTSTEIGEYDVFLRDDDGDIVRYNAYADYRNKKEDIYDVMDDAPDCHGTHVCGIISILIHEMNLEKYIKILPIKAAYPKTDSSSFPFNAVQKAIVFALQNNADVVNMSFSGGNTYQTLVTANYAKEAVFCAAAGNEKTSATHYPAASSNCIGVMGYTYDTKGEKIFYENSNFGSAYDIMAPAVKLISADGSADDRYKTLSGTSMACPVVSFAAACATLKYGAIEKGIGLETTPNEISALIKGAHSDVVRKGGKNYFPLDFNVLMNADNFAYCKIDIDSGSSKQTINNVSKVSAHIVTYPQSAAEKGSVQWTVKHGDTVIKESSEREISFLPLSKVGTVTVDVKWTYLARSYSDQYIVTVDYADPDSSRISMKAESIVDMYEGNFIAGYQVQHTLSGLDYVSPETIGTIMWYVDGIYSGVNGKTFTYLNETSGTVRISAKYNGNLLAEFTENYVSEDVIPKEDKKDDKVVEIVLITAAAVLGAALVAAFIAFAIKKKKASKSTVNKDDDEPDTDALGIDFDEDQVLREIGPDEEPEIPEEEQQVSDETNKEGE